MTTGEQKFLSELDLLRRESETASQFLYSYLAIHQVAKKRKKVHRALDRHALFWNTVAGALQSSAIVALHRVFDQGTGHGVDRLLGLAQNTPTMFSKAALAARKRGASLETEPEWLADFMAGVEEPTPSAFRDLRKQVSKLRRIYELRYRDLRNTVIAHAVAVDPTDVAPIAAKANINELKRLLSSLLSLHQALFDLFWNGRPPVLRRIRYSAKVRKGLSSQARPHERIVAEVEQVLRAVARTADTRPAKR